MNCYLGIIVLPKRPYSHGLATACSLPCTLQDGDFRRRDVLRCGWSVTFPLLTEASVPLFSVIANAYHITEAPPIYSPPVSLSSVLPESIRVLSDAHFVEEDVPREPDDKSLESGTSCSLEILLFHSGTLPPIPSWGSLWYLWSSLIVHTFSQWQLII